MKTEKLQKKNTKKNVGKITDACLPSFSLSEILASPRESRNTILSSVSGSLPKWFGTGSFGEDARIPIFELDENESEIGGLGDRSW